MNKTVTVDQIGKDPQVYEAGYHIVPITSEADLGARVTAIRDAIEAHGGVTITDEYPKLSDLAYEMVHIADNKRAKYNSAYFGWIKFEAVPGAIGKIDAALKGDDAIIRHMIVKTVRENTMVPKKVLMQKRGADKDTERAPEPARPAMTQEELDKTIEELVIS